jgi:hypothetical protein
MEVPAQSRDDPGAFCDEIFAVIDEQAQFTFDSVESGHRQVRFAQCGPGDRESVDGI